MRTFDLTPFQRSTIGFDRLFSLLDQAAGLDNVPAYPPYNIERTAENAYRISLAVAGFTPNDLTIETRENTLVVRGEKQSTDAENRPEFLHQGIASRAFERRFQLADHVMVTSADLAHGLLHIELVRELPEAMKPRTIAIGGAQDKTRLIETAEKGARKAA